MHFINRIATVVLFVFISINTAILAQTPPVSQLTSIQTAEPLGKGGSLTTIGLFQYSKETLEPEEMQAVFIGGFERQAFTSLEIETFFIPVRFTYGLSNKVDLNLGATLSVGNVHKVVDDFYDTDELDVNPNRVYDQPLYEGVIGLKYNLKPEKNDGLPSLSIGTEFSSGFTADDRLNTKGEFLDPDPIDGYPFAGVNTYFVATQRVGAFIKLHGGAGVLLSTKSLRTTDSFSFSYFGGGEIAVADNMWFAADYSREQLYSGVSLSNVMGLAFRYEVSSTLAFQIGINNLPGFQFNLTLGGERSKEMEGTKLLF